MNDPIVDAALVTGPKNAMHQLASPRRHSIAFLTLLIGAAITVVAATFEMGIFNPVLRLRGSSGETRKETLGL